MLQFLKNKLTQFSFLKSFTSVSFRNFASCICGRSHPLWEHFPLALVSFLFFFFCWNITFTFFVFDLFILRTSIHFKPMLDVFGNSIIFFVTWSHFLFISLLSGMLSYPVKDLSQCFPSAKSSQVTNHNSRCSVNACKLLILVDLCDFLFLFSCLNNNSRLFFQVVLPVAWCHKSS